jgi:hypothetical protein
MVLTAFFAPSSLLLSCERGRGRGGGAEGVRGGRKTPGEVTNRAKSRCGSRNFAGI